MLKGKFRINSGAWQDNVVLRGMNTGIGVILNGLISPLPIEVTTVALGDGTTPASENDTGLENEIAEAQIAYRERQAVDTVLLQFFFNNQELPNGTYTELGLKVGSKFLTRALFTAPYEKEEGTDTIVEYLLIGDNEYQS